MFRFIRCLAAFGAGAALLGIALIKDMKGILTAVNDNAIIDKNHAKCFNQFCQLIEMLSMIKQLSDDFCILFLEKLDFFHFFLR